MLQLACIDLHVFKFCIYIFECFQILNIILKTKIHFISIKNQSISTKFSDLYVDLKNTIVLIMTFFYFIWEINKINKFDFFQWEILNIFFNLDLKTNLFFCGKHILKIPHISINIDNFIYWPKFLRKRSSFTLKNPILIEKIYSTKYSIFSFYIFFSKCC